jgi:uncharacterized protein YxeA
VFKLKNYLITGILLVSCLTVLLVLTPSHTASSAGCNILAISGVTASGSQTGNPPTNAIDTNLGTRWSNLGKGSSVTVDFGKERAICSANISWYLGDQRINDFVIAVSKDGQSFNTVFSGKSTGNTAQFENYDFPDTTGRYVKITVNGNTVNNWASISEIRVLGDLIADVPNDNMPPTISSTSPADGATNIPITTAVVAVFNEPMLTSSFTASTFFVKASGSSTNVAGPRWLDSSSGYKTAVFRSSSNLNPSTTYVATITTGVKDAAGNSLTKSKTWSFTTTGGSPNPNPSPNDCNKLSISKVSESGGTHSLGPKNAIDGNQDTRWSMKGAGSTITMDIGKKHVICNVDISWYRGTERISNFVISLSKDGKSFTSVFSGTSSGGTDGFERYNFPDASARYVKITVNGNTLNNWASINEIRVFGDPTTTTPPPPKQEICGDGIDNNGNGQIDEGCSPPPPPPKQEICGDGIDNNGNGQIDEGCSTPPPPPPGSDGVKEIYPTAPGGATWFFNPDNPIDGQFDPNGAQISKNSDGSWHLKPGTTRMLTFPKSDGMLSDSFRSNLPTYDYSQLAQIGYWYKPTDWKNTEVTGYFKVTSTNSGDGISLVTRSVRHSTSVHNGCGGSAYHNNIKFDGTFQYKKEMWHVNYDTLPPTKSGIGSIMNKWVGFKGIVYNLPNGNVKLESYVDKDANNNWQKVEELVDSGNWGNDMTHCGANKPGAQITWTSPMPIFKSNGVTYDFKKLSVREIVPPS